MSSCVEEQVEQSDCFDTDNAIVNEISVLSHAGGDAWEQVRALTILKLTCWVCGTNPSTLERKGARSGQIGELK